MAGEDKQVSVPLPTSALLIKRRLRRATVPQINDASATVPQGAKDRRHLSVDISQSVVYRLTDTQKRGVTPDNHRNGSGAAPKQAGSSNLVDLLSALALVHIKQEQQADLSQAELMGKDLAQQDGANKPESPRLR